MESIQAELINLVIVVITALVGWVAQKVTAYFKEKGLITKLETNKELVRIVVNAVEQTYKHLDGDEKLKVAKIELVKLMNEKKIKISEKEIDTLIESAVKEMNDVIKKELNKDK